MNIYSDILDIESPSVVMNSLHPATPHASTETIRNSGQPLSCVDPCPPPLTQSLQVLSETTAQRMAEFFGVLADPNRLRLLSLLAEQELCVCDLAALTQMSESAVSHKLRTLRTMRVVRYRKQGRKVFYSLDDSHILQLFQTTAAHLNES